MAVNPEVLGVLEDLYPERLNLLQGFRIHLLVKLVDQQLLHSRGDLFKGEVAETNKLHQEGGKCLLLNVKRGHSIHVHTTSENLAKNKGFDKKFTQDIIST